MNNQIGLYNNLNYHSGITKERNKKKFGIFKLDNENSY